MPRRKQGHFQASKRIANNTDRPIGRGRLRKRHNHDSSNKNTVTLSIGSLVTKNGGRGSLRSRSAMLKASQLPTARVPSPPTDHDKPLYQHKKFQRIDCTSPQTINEIPQVNTAEDSGGKSETSITATIKSVAVEEADNGKVSASGDALRSKKNASLEALLKVTELEIIKSSTGNVCLTKNASIGQSKTLPTTSSKKSSTTPNGDVNVTKNSRTNNISKIDSENIQSESKAMVDSIDPVDSVGTVDPTGFCEEQDKKKAKNFRHICPYCDHGCAKPSVLRKHIRAHTNERPYPCRLCHFAFKTKSNLYKHRKSRAHTLRVTGSNADPCDLIDSNDESDKISKDGDSEISSDSVPVDSVNNNIIKVASVMPSVSSSKPDSIKDNCYSKIKLENPEVKAEKNQVPISCGQASNPLPFGSISNISQSKDKSNAEKDIMFSSSCSNLAASCPSSPSIHVKTTEGGLRKNSGVITQNSPAKSSSGSGIVYKPKFHFTVDHQIPEEESGPSETHRSDLSSSQIASSLSSDTSLCSRNNVTDKNNQNGSVKDFEGNTGLHNKAVKSDSQDCKDGLMLRMMEGQPNISHPTPSYSPSSSRSVQATEGMPDKIVMESSNDTAELAESTAVKGNELIHESTAVSSASNSAQSQSNPAPTACLPSSSISSSLSSSSTPTTATITTTTKSTLKTPKLSSPEFLEQHISNLIMRNIEIVETQNPFWSRRFVRQSSVASSQNVDAELRARDRRIPRDTDGNQSKLAHALLKPDCESASYRHSTGTQSLPATPSIILSAPPFTGAVLPDTKNQIYSLGVDKNTLIQSATAIVAKEDSGLNNSDPSSAVKTLLVSAKHSPNSNSDTANKLTSGESDERRKMDNSVLHPQNPEGSIIKNLLLTKRTAPQNTATLTAAVTTAGGSFPGSVPAPSEKVLIDSVIAVAPETSSIPMYTCLVCRTSFRSPETLLAHQAHYCKRSQKQLTFPLSPSYSSDSDSGRSSKSGMFPTPVTSASTTRPPDVAPKPRGRPKGSKNRPKDVLLIGNNQRILPANKSPHKQQPPVFPQQPVVSVQYPAETQLPADHITGTNIQYKSGGPRGGSSSPADGPILKNHLLSGKLSGDKSPPLKKRKVPEEVLPKDDPHHQRSHSNSSSGSSISTLKSLEELSRHPMRPNSVQLFGGEVQICDGTETKKMKVDTAIQQPTVSGSSSSIMPSQVLPLLGGVSVGGENIPNSAVVVTIAKPVLNSGGTVMQVHDSKACSAPPVCIPVVALGQPLMATGYSSTMLSSEPHSVMSPTSSLPTSRFNEVGAIVLSTNIPTSLPINSSGFYSIDISHLQINTVASTLQTKTVGSSNPPMTLLDSTSTISSSKEINSNNPASLKRSSSSKSPSPLVNSSMHINTALHIPQDPQKISLKEVVQANDVEMVPKDNSLFNENNNRPVSKSESSTIPTITIQPASSPKISHETATTTTVTSTVTAAVTTSSDKSKSFLAPPRPTSLAIKSTHSSLVGTTLISPETPRPKKKYEQLYLNGQYYTYLGLKCSTRVYYCCIYRPQPMYVPQSTDSKLSMYSNWQTVPAEPGPFNLSPGAAMALYDSRNKYTSYTMAHPKKMEYILTHSSYWTFRKHKENVASEAEPIITDVEEKKPMIAKEEIPSESISSHAKTPPETTPASAVVSEALVAAANEEAAPPVVKVKNREREPKRVRIFEGGYKSNEEYIYVRGRGRGKYVCEECGIRCKKPSMLKKHIRTHTDVRPFTCKHCNFSFKTKGNLTKHMKSKAHHKKCIELGIDPVPVTIDEAQIDEEALAKQERLEKERGQYIDDDEDTDDEDEDGEEEDDEDEDDEDDDEESLDGESSEERCGSSASRIHSGQFEDAVDDAVNSVISLGHSEDMSSNTSSKFPSEHEIARSLLDLSNHGTADFSASTNINLHSMRSIPSICVGDIHSKMLMSPMMTMESSSVPESRLHHQIPTIEVKDQSDPMSGCGPEELIGSPRVVWASNQKQLRVDVDRPGTSPLLSHDGTVPSEIHFKYHYSSSVTSPSQSDMGSSAPSFQETAVCHLNVPRGESLGVTPYQEPPLIHTGPTQTADNIGGTPGFAEGLRPQVLPPGGSSFPDTLAVSPGPYSPLPMSDKMVSPGRSYAPSTSVNFVKSYDHSPKILQPHHDYPSTPIPPLPSAPESETMETDEGDDYDEPMDLSSKASQRHELSGNYLEDISRIHFQRSTSPMASGSECSLEGRYPPRGTRLAFPVNSPPPANLHSSHSVHSNDDPCDLKSAEIYEAISPPLSEPERPLEEPSGYRPTVPNPTLPQNFPSPNGTRALLPAANPVWDPPAPDTSGNSMLHAYLTDKQVNKSGSKISAGSKIAFHIAASTASGSHSKLGDFPISSSRMSTSPGAQFNFRQITPASPSTADKCNKPQAEFLLPSGTKQVMYSHRSMDDGKCVCSICNKSFTKPSQLRLHVNIHYFERPFRCDSCAVSFRTKGHLQKHRRSVSHYNKVNMNMTFGTPTTDNPRPFKCGDCKIAFRIHGHLAKHLRSKMHIMKLECLGKLPFGTYAEIERSGVNLNEIDTTDCENSLESLQVMAQRLYDKEPHRHQRWTRERTVSGCSADSGEVVDDSPEGGRYRRLSMSDTGHLSPEYVDLEMIPPPSGVALSDVQNISDVKQEPLELLNSSDNIAAGNYMRAQWETARQTSVESLGQEYEDISDAESEPEATASCSLCRRIFKDIKALQLHLYVDHPDVGGEGTVEGSSTSSGIQDNPSSSLRSRRSVSLSEDSSVILEMRRSAIAASSVTMQMRRNTYSKEGTIGVEMRQGSSLSADALMNMDSGKGPLANKSSLSLELRGESPLPIPVEAQLSGMAENIMDTRKCSSNSFPVRNDGEIGSVAPSGDDDRYLAAKTSQATSYSFPSEEAQNQNISCNICGKQYGSRSNLKQHMMTHVQLRPFVCEVCDAGFTSKEFLWHHRLTHNQERHSVCAECNSSFPSATELSQHYLTHHSKSEKDHVR